MVVGIGLTGLVKHARIFKKEEDESKSNKIIDRIIRKHQVNEFYKTIYNEKIKL